MDRFFPTSDTWCYALAAFCGAVSLAVLYVALAHDRAKGRRRCPKCWYDMAGTATTCPECGYVGNNARAFSRTRRRWRWATVGVLIAVYAAVSAWMPDYRMWGWAHRLPSVVLVRMYPWAAPPNGVTQLRTDKRPVVCELSSRGYSHRLGGHERTLAVRCLKELRTQSDWIRRRDAYILLGHCGQGSTDADTLIALVRAETDPKVVLHAWNALAGASASDPTARECLIAQLREHPNDTVAGLIKRLPDSGEHAVSFVPVLAELLRIGTEAAPAEAAWKLMRIGPPASEALPTLDALIAVEAKPMMVGAAACIRGELRDDAAVFAGWLQGPDPQVRLSGAHMLSSGELQERGHAVTDEIVAALLNPRPDDDSQMEACLCEATRMRGRRALRAIPYLERLAARPGLDPATAERLRWQIDYIRDTE